MGTACLLLRGGPLAVAGATCVLPQESPETNLTLPLGVHAFCYAQVPTTPNYIEVNETLSTFGPLAPAQNGSGLPPCGGAPAAPPSPAPDDGTGNSTSTGAEDEGGSSNTAAIVGGVVGGVAGLCGG